MWLQTIELIITSKLICNVCMYQKKNFEYFNDAVEFVGFFPHIELSIYIKEKKKNRVRWGMKIHV